MEPFPATVAIVPGCTEACGASPIPWTNTVPITACPFRAITAFCRKPGYCGENVTETVQPLGPQALSLNVKSPGKLNVISVDDAGKVMGCTTPLCPTSTGSNGTETAAGAAFPTINASGKTASIRKPNAPIVFPNSPTDTRHIGQSGFRFGTAATPGHNQPATRQIISNPNQPNHLPEIATRAEQPSNFRPCYCRPGSFQAPSPDEP